MYDKCENMYDENEKNIGDGSDKMNTSYNELELASINDFSDYNSDEYKAEIAKEKIETEGIKENNNIDTNENDKIGERVDDVNGDNGDNDNDNDNNVARAG